MIALENRRSYPNSSGAVRRAPPRLANNARDLALSTKVALAGLRLNAGELIAFARDRSGLHDVAADIDENALQLLLEAYIEEADLSLVGRVAAHWDLFRLIINRLIFADREREDPTISTRPLSAPIVITGLPRSGTTFLHELLALDENARAPLCWETIYPYPTHPCADRNAGPKEVARQLAWLHRLAPRLKSLHPIRADLPQECAELTAHSFTSFRFETTHHVPSYKGWVAGADHGAAYGLHRRFLQHLQGSSTPRWVLKAPDHVFALEALRAVYPDAHVIFCHRDPLKILPSVAKLTETLRRPFARRVDPFAIGRQIADDWARGADIIVRADRDELWPRRQIAHVQFTRLIRDPIATVEAIYHSFDLPFALTHAERIAARIAGCAKGGYGDNRYAFDDYGLKIAAERERFDGYVRAFDVPAEPLAS